MGLGMTCRVHILVAMRCQPVDRIPFVPNLNGYAIKLWVVRVSADDTASYGASVGNIEAVVRAVKKYGRYPLQSGPAAEG